jgi:aspartate aminotransferase-like enzyme
MRNNKTKLFTVGPVQMYEHTIGVRNQGIPYFRTPEFSELMLDNKKLLLDAVDAEENAEENAEVIFLTASGSGAMEATVMNCFDAQDKLLVISGGTFGERFAHICEIQGIPFEALRLGTDETLTAGHFAKYEHAGFTGLLVNLHETSTGQLYDIKIIKDFCERNHLYLIVDAISSFLCDEYHMKKYGIDATIISSQKGLCLAPGLSMVVLSKKLVDERVLKLPTRSVYFDFKDYILNIKRGQTPFTPCVGILFELNDMLHHIGKQGVENRVREVEARADYFREQIVKLPVQLPPFPLSNAITPIRFEQDIAQELFIYLKDEKHMIVNPSGGELGKRSIRVAHIGDLGFADYDRLIGEIKHFLGI